MTHQWPIDRIRKARHQVKTRDFFGIHFSNELIGKILVLLLGGGAVWAKTDEVVTKADIKDLAAQVQQVNQRVMALELRLDNVSAFDEVRPDRRRTKQ